MYIGYFSPPKLKLDDPKFLARLQRLENHLKRNYEITMTKDDKGWYCAPKPNLSPGFVVTNESVLFVMKFIGI